jgi:hypothetical protein
VGLGTGKHEMRAATLREALMMQQQIWAQYGPTNGLVSMTGMRNAFADILALSGIHNANRYVNPMDPEIEEQLLMRAEEAAKAQQGQASDPAQAIMQAEAMKAQTRAQSDMARIQADMQKFMFKQQADQQKAAADDDLARDKMTQDLLVKAAEIIGKYGTEVEVAQIRQMQAQPRQFGGMI